MKGLFNFIIILVLQSCVQTLPDEELTMGKIPYTGTEFRIDGCYETKLSSDIRSDDSRFIVYTFFYSNGIVLSFMDSPNIEQRSQISQGIWSYKGFWGVFQVDSNLIRTQGWIEGGGTFVKQMVLKEDKYTIINDTTLYRENSKGYKSYFYFKRFNPKPDSTNVFIK